MFDAGLLSSGIGFDAEKTSLVVKDGDIVVKRTADHRRTRAVRVHFIGASQGGKAGALLHAVRHDRALCREASLPIKGYRSN